MKVTSEIISVSPTAYARTAVLRLAGKWWWIIVMPMLILLIASLWNTACIVAAMIWLLMLLPPAIMIAFYSYLLKPEASATSRPHSITVDEQQITLDFKPLDTDTDDDTPDEAHPIDTINLPHNAITSIADKGNRIELFYRKAPLDILIIPIASLPYPRSEQALKLIYNE